jgi:hypothetical protein
VAKKSTTKKVKSMLAMLAFAAVFCVSVVTTSFGAVSYVVNHGGQTTAEVSEALIVPVSAASLLSNVSPFQGK